MRAVTVPRLYFICGMNMLLDGLATGVMGIAGLGRTEASLPAQFSSNFGFDRKFALCLSSSIRSSGDVFFGNGPYTLHPEVDVSSSLTYAPLIINPFNENGYDGDVSSKYFIGVKSIKINGKSVRLNKSLLSYDDRGYSGTSISKTDPDTLLESSIYNAVVTAFAKAMPKNVTRIPNIAPFGACYNSKHIPSTRMGPDVPFIDLVLQSKSVYWRIYGANSMVKLKTSDLLKPPGQLSTPGFNRQWRASD